MNWHLLRRQVPLVREMAMSYFGVSLHGRRLLAGLVFLLVSNAILAISVSYLNKSFYNALNAKEGIPVHPRVVQLLCRP